MTKGAINLIEAVLKGYYVKSGQVFSKKGKIKNYLSNSGYYSFTIRDGNGERANIKVHRLVAFQKYGDVMFNDNLVVRHLDGNPLNNSEDNISIGTQTDNRMDIPPDIRKSLAVNASSYFKKYNHDEVKKFRKEGMTYKQIMLATGIKSKGTVSWIINKS